MGTTIAEFWDFLVEEGYERRIDQLAETYSKKTDAEIAELSEKYEMKAVPQPPAKYAVRAGGFVAPHWTSQPDPTWAPVKISWWRRKWHGARLQYWRNRRWLASKVAGFEVYSYDESYDW
jgi:hypothetical protein